MNIDTIITNDNDIYIYFKLIEQIQPSSILDVGLFLQRIGAVSRQAMSCEIPHHIYLEGLECFAQTPLPIYSQIYNQITILPEFAFYAPNTYDLAFYLRMKDWIHPDDRLFFWEYLITHARIIIADTSDPEFVDYAVTNCQCEAINIENEQYAIIHGNFSQ